MSNLSELNKKRGLIKGKVTSLRNYFSSVTRADRMQLSLRLSKFEPCYNEFSLLQDEIELIDTNPEQIIERENFEQSYFTLVADIKTFLDDSRSFESTTVSSRHIGDCGTVRRPNLPLLKLHKFDGAYSAWNAFKDSFESLVGSNHSISNVEKLQYLRALLIGPALKTIQSLPITNENYLIAWQRLKNRFENKRPTVNSHLNAIFNLPGAKANSNVCTRQIYDGFSVNIEALHDLRELKKKRSLIKGRVTSLREYFSLVTPADRMQLSLRLSKFEPCYNEFSLLQDEIELIDTNPEQIIERETFEQSYFTLVADIKTFLDDSRSFESTTVSSRHKGDCGTVRRPNLPLLHKFDGTYSAWNAFKDSFESLVGSNHSISNAEKLQYLRASLIGSALQTIQSLPITNANYLRAWQRLKDRFENKRLIVNSHLNAIFNLPGAKANSNVCIRQVYDGLSFNIEALRNLGEPVDSWSSIIVYVISTKFDFMLQREWESYCDATKVPTFDQLKQFLKKKSELLETLAINRPEREPQQRNHPRRRDVPQAIQSYAVTQNASCPICYKIHHRYRKCEKLVTRV